MYTMWICESIGKTGGRWAWEALLQAPDLMLQSHLFLPWAMKDCTILQPFGSPLKNCGGDNPSTYAAEVELPELLDETDGEDDEQDDPPNLASSEGVNGLFASMQQASTADRSDALASIFMFFEQRRMHVFVVQNGGLGVCRAFVQGKRGSVMFVIVHCVHCVHCNIVPHIATPCCLFRCDFQPWLTMLFPAWLACTFRALGNMCLPIFLIPLVMGTTTSI